MDREAWWATIPGSQRGGHNWATNTFTFAWVCLLSRLPQCRQLRQHPIPIVQGCQQQHPVAWSSPGIIFRAALSCNTPDKTLPHEQFSPAPRRVDFQQVPEGGIPTGMSLQWALCHLESHGCALSKKIWISSLARGRGGLLFLGAVSVYICSLYLLLLYSLAFFLLLTVQLLITPILFANKGLYGQSYGFSSSHVWMWELDHKEGWAPKNWRFRTMVLEKTLESPLDFKEIKPAHPKGNQSWTFIGRTDAEAETPILWPPDAKSQLIRKDPDAGKDWRQ